MRPIVTGEEYRRIDKAWKGDLVQAMDKAGYAVALAASRAGAGYGSRVVVLAGPGNNGGDGYVAARYLKDRGADVVVHAFGSPKTVESADAAHKARRSGVRVVDIGPPMEGIPGQDTTDAARRLFAALEDYIRLAPEQYLWTYKKFKRRPAEYPDPYVRNTD